MDGASVTEWRPAPHRFHADLGNGLALELTEAVCKEIDFGDGLKDFEDIRERWVLSKNGTTLRTVDVEGNQQVLTAWSLLAQDIMYQVDAADMPSLRCEAMRACPSTTREGVDELARIVYESGHALEYMLKSCAEYHVGDVPALTAMLLTEAAKRVRNGKGIHISISGEAGTGKSHVAATAAKHLPKDAVLDARLSDKALFYHPISSGTTLVMDDQELSDDFQELLKNASTDWSVPATYLTVNNQKPLTLSLPPRCPFWLVKANLTGDEQTLDRCLMFWTDDSVEQKLAIQRAIFQAAANPDMILGEGNVPVCRKIWDYVEAQTVLVPFAGAIGCDVNMDPRNINLLIDLIQAHALLAGAQREHDAKTKAVIATVDDFVAAARLINPILENHGGSQKLKLSKPEGRILDYLAQCETGDIPFSSIRMATGLSKSIISDALNGRPDKGGICGKGLLSKCPALDVLDESHSGDGRMIHGKIVRWNHEYYISWLEGTGMFFIDPDKLSNL